MAGTVLSNLSACASYSSIASANAKAIGPAIIRGSYRLLEQLIDQFEVSLLVGSLHLLTEFLYFAIGLGLGFVTADNFRHPF
jgi:hypothetical protein